MATTRYSDQAETGETIRGKLLALPDSERKFVVTNSGPGRYKIVAMRRNELGHLEYDYENDPES